MTASANKDLVLAWMKAGPYDGRSMLAEDFVWHTPRGTADLLNDGEPDFHGPDAPAHLKEVSKSAYLAEAPSSYDLEFCIAEGDWVVWQALMGKTSFRGRSYTNRYVFCARCRDGKIAEIYEHADTKVWLDAVVPTQADKAELTRTIREARAKLG
jgi:ketosteroid isomerase-like protein